jgi:IclR family transcriptional regulator, KDG regulon repressor
VSQSVRAVERALDVLLCFTGGKATRSLAQIAESVQMPKATVHRLLTALEKKRFIYKDKVPGRYSLDSRLIEWASISAHADMNRPSTVDSHELSSSFVV